MHRRGVAVAKRDEFCLGTQPQAREMILQRDAAATDDGMPIGFMKIQWTGSMAPPSPKTSNEGNEESKSRCLGMPEEFCRAPCRTATGAAGLDNRFHYDIIMLYHIGLEIYQCPKGNIYAKTESNDS